MKEIEAVYDELRNIINDLAEKVDILTTRVSELEQPSAPEKPEGLLPEAERIAAVPAWDAARKYHEGEVCRHQDKLWRALPDVANFAPDETYDLDANTGGWQPLHY